MIEQPRTATPGKVQVGASIKNTISRPSGSTALWSRFSIAAKIRVDWDGRALRHGIPHCQGEIVVIQDADMEYDPSDVPDLIALIQRQTADVVYGSRLSGGRPQRAYMFWHLIGNRLLSLLTGLLFNTTSPTWRRATRPSAATC